MRRIHVSALAFALIVLFLPASLHAQVTGTISGYVQDQGAGSVPGATVTAELAGQQLVRSTQSNETGFFDLQTLPRGMYVVKVEIAGFQTQIQRDVEVTAGANVRLDFSLNVGGVTEQVVVSGQATMVESRNATQSNLIDDQRVQDLPMNGRNVVALAGTYAGVTSIRANQDTSDGRQGPIMSVNGGNTNHNLFTLNGSMFTHFNQTTGFNPPPPDAIQEIRIQTHNFSAEYGHTAGGQVSIVTKAGSNAFHGTAWEFHRNSALNTKSYFLKTRRVAKGGAEAEPGGRQRRRRHHPEQAVLVRLVSAALGPVRGRVESDDRADQRAANRQLHGARTRVEESDEPADGRALYRQHGRAVYREQHHQGRLYQPRFERIAGCVRAGVRQRHDCHVDARSARSRGLHGPRRLSLLEQQSAERALLRRPKRQHLVAGKPELRAAVGLQRRESIRRQRCAHLQSEAGQRSHVLVPDVEIRRRRRHADRSARSGGERRPRQRRARHELLHIGIDQPCVSGHQLSGLLQLPVERHDDLTTWATTR